ncbi:MAG: hypothetical protein V4529_02990 [Gemmatimonadota bacterium]
MNVVIPTEGADESAPWGSMADDMMRLSTLAGVIEFLQKQEMGFSPV